MAKKQTKSGDFKPQLQSGNDFFETASAFQKYIRRCDKEKALNFGWDLFQTYHNYVWKRLVTCCFEDVGLANPELTSNLLSYYLTYKELISLKTPQGKDLAWLATAKAISLTAMSNKNRLVDNAKLWAMKSGTTYELTHNSNGKEDDGLLESFEKACYAQDEKRALIYAQKYLRTFGAKGIFSKMVEVSLLQQQPEIHKYVTSIKYLFDELLSPKKEYNMTLTFITILLCRNDIDFTLNAIAAQAQYGAYACDIPEFAIDFHTRRGKKKGLKYFIAEGSKINNEVSFDGDAEYWEFSQKYMLDYDAGIVTENGYQSDDEPQKTLFG